jgi:hypothetical protein
MPYFGLTSADIVRAFTGAKISDFDAGGNNGASVIDSEIALQYAKLRSALNERVRRLISISDYEIVTVAPDGKFTTAMPAAGIPKLGYPGAGLCQEYSCQPPLLIMDAVVSAADASGINWIVANPKPGEAVVRYAVDGSKLILPTLAAILRDIVACAMGRRLYPSGQEEWKQVTHYCDDAKDGLAQIKHKTFIPHEIAGIRRYWQPSPITAMKVNRG